MTTAELVRILRATDLFASVPSEDLEAVAAASRLRVFRRGQIVCTAGQLGDIVEGNHLFFPPPCLSRTGM